jgi:hypothetical protein
MGSQQQMIDLIKKMSGQNSIIAVQKLYVSLLGEANAALLLSQLVYWSDKATRVDGFIYKSYKDWAEEIGLSQYQVKRAADYLVKVNLAKKKLHRADGAPTLHYKVDFDVLVDAIIKKLDNPKFQLASKPKTGFKKASKPDYEESSQSDYKESSQSDYEESSQSLTETTQETTQEINIPEKEHSGTTPKNLPDQSSEAKPSDANTHPKNQSPKASKPKKERDPRIDNPAMVVYRGIAKYYVPDSWRDEVCTVTDLELWKSIVKGWIGKGWNPRNVEGMLKVYKEGGLKERNGNGFKSPEAANIVDVDEEFRRQNQKLFRPKEATTA